MNKELELKKEILDIAVDNGWKVFGHNGRNRFSIKPTESGVIIQYQHKHGLPIQSKHHDAELACDTSFLEAMYIHRLKILHGAEKQSAAFVQEMYDINKFVMNGFQIDLISNITKESGDRFTEICTEFFSVKNKAEEKLDDLGVA